MQKIIVSVAMFRGGVKKFEKEVNEYLDKGWKVMSYSVEKKGLRLICTALLSESE